MIFNEIMSSIVIGDDDIKKGIKIAQQCKAQEKKYDRIILIIFVFLVFQYLQYFYDNPYSTIVTFIVLIIIRVTLSKKLKNNFGKIKDAYFEECEINYYVALCCCYLDDRKPRQRWMYLLLINILYQYNKNELADEVLEIYLSNKGNSPEYEPYLSCIYIYKAYLNKDLKEMERLYSKISFKKIHSDIIKSNIEIITKLLFRLLELQVSNDVENIEVNCQSRLMRVLFEYEVGNIYMGKYMFDNAKERFEFVINNGIELPCVKESKIKLKEINKCQEKI